MGSVGNASARFPSSGGCVLGVTAASRSTASVVGGRRGLAHLSGMTERFAQPMDGRVIEDARGHTMSGSAADFTVEAAGLVARRMVALTR